MTHTIERGGENQGAGALPASQDRATHEQSPQAVSAVPVGIPSAAYREGWVDAIDAAVAIAIKWRDENKAACARARKRENAASALGFETPELADQLDGAAIECNAIAGAIRELRPAQAIETRRAETEGLGAKHESAVGETDAPNSQRTGASK